MKYVIFVALALAFSGVTFVAGMEFADHRSRIKNLNEILDVALRVHHGVKSCSGSIRPDSPDYKNIKGTIHVFKDIDLAVVDQGGVIVIKAYE